MLFAWGTSGCELPLMGPPHPKSRKSYLLSHHPKESRGGESLGTEREKESSHYFSLIAHEWPSPFTPLQPGTAPHYRLPPLFSQETPMKRPWKASSDRGPARLDQLTEFFSALTRHTAICNSSTVRDSPTSEVRLHSLFQGLKGCE